MALNCNMIVDRKDHVQYLTVSKSYLVTVHVLPDYSDKRSI